MEIDTDHIFFTEDGKSVWFGPLAQIFIPGQTGTQEPIHVQAWDEILKTNIKVVERAVKGRIYISKDTWEAILIWCNNYQELMPLHEYLNKMFLPSRP